VNGCTGIEVSQMSASPRLSDQGRRGCTAAPSPTPTTVSLSAVAPHALSQRPAAFSGGSIQERQLRQTYERDQIVGEIIGDVYDVIGHADWAWGSGCALHGVM
jgi:hypothetical protein